MFGTASLKCVKDGWGVECEVCRSGGALKRYWQKNFKENGTPTYEHFAAPLWYLTHVHAKGGGAKAYHGDGSFAEDICAAATLMNDYHVYQGGAPLSAPASGLVRATIMSGSCVMRSRPKKHHV